MLPFNDDQGTALDSHQNSRTGQASFIQDGDAAGPVDLWIGDDLRLIVDEEDNYSPQHADLRGGKTDAAVCEHHPSHLAGEIGQVSVKASDRLAALPQDWVWNHAQAGIVQATPRGGTCRHIATSRQSRKLGQRTQSLQTLAGNRDRSTRMKPRRVKNSTW